MLSLPSVAVCLPVAASLLLRPAQAISNAHVDQDPDIAPAPDPVQVRVHVHVHDLEPGVFVQWPRVPEGDAEQSLQATVAEQIRTHQSGEYNRLTAPLDGGLELKRSEGDGGEGAVLLRRESNAAPTIFGISIWLIIAWLALLYMMIKTGSLF